MALLVDASQRDDRQELDRILDLDKITESFVSDVRSKVTGTSILNSLVPSQLDQIVSNITPKLKETLREVLPAEIRRVTEPAKGKPVFLIALGAPYSHHQAERRQRDVDLSSKTSRFNLQ